MVQLLEITQGDHNWESPVWGINRVKRPNAAKESLDRKFGAVYDKVYREDVLMESWRQVRANKGAPGVD
jgi:hypothetical protein